MYLFKTILVLFGLALTISSIQSQEPAVPCLFDKIYRDARNDTNIAARLLKNDSLITDWIRGNQYQDVTFRSTIRIPLVIHIVWKDSSENISNAQVYSQLDVINEDFRKLNGEIVSLPESFKSISADVGIEFCLAEKDPDDNPTSGITRTRTFIDNIGRKTELYYSDLGGHDAWDTKSYLNIWVSNMGEGIAGYGSLPGVDPEDRDGVRIDYEYFGLTDNEPYHLGRTLTHEIGHYLNLFHLWGSGIDNPNCTQDDKVPDTPIQSGSYFGKCPTMPQGSCGSQDMFMNYMNFTDDSCMAAFTIGQKLRILATLNTLRKGLLNTTSCHVSSPHTSSLFTDEIKIYPNPTTNYLYISSRYENVLGGKITITMNDITGRTCLSKELLIPDSGYFFDVLDLMDIPPGTYLLRIFSSEREIQKLILVN